LVQKETFADALLTVTVSQRSLQNSPLESSCVVVALMENYSTSKPLKVSSEKSLILGCDTVVANEQYNNTCFHCPAHFDLETIKASNATCCVYFDSC
jgi:hypothetical protein